MNDKQKRLFGLVCDMLARHYLNGEELAPGFLDHGVLYSFKDGEPVRMANEQVSFVLKSEDGTEDYRFNIENWSDERPSS